VGDGKRERVDEDGSGGGVRGEEGSEWNDKGGGGGGEAWVAVGSRVMGVGVVGGGGSGG